MQGHSRRYSIPGSAPGTGCQDTVEHDEFPGVHFFELATIPEAVELLFRNDQVIKQFDVQKVAGIDEFFCGGDFGPGRL